MYEHVTFETFAVGLCTTVCTGSYAAQHVMYGCYVWMFCLDVIHGCAVWMFCMNVLFGCCAWMSCLGVIVHGCTVYGCIM